MFEERALGKIFGPKTEKVVEEWGNYTIRNIIICTLLQKVLG
jgi:hypothetical protein